MAGTRKRLEPHTFYCINCWKPGITIWRNIGRQRERNHRKALYCTNCKTTVNHIEIKTEEEAEQFRRDFDSGKYRAEAAESIKYAKERNRA